MVSKWTHEKIHWLLRDRISQSSETQTNEYLKKLARGPIFTVVTYQGYDINGYTFYTKANDSRSKCENSGVRVDTEDSTRKKIRILGTSKKFGKSIMECLYKFLYLNVNGWSIDKVLRWMNMGSQLLTWEMWIIKKNFRFSLQPLLKYFTYLIRKMRRNTL